MTTPESLTRSEAHRKLLALGMPADLAGDCLDHEQVRYANASNYPGAWPILEAYQRHCAARTDPLDTVPPEERERIVATAKGAAVAAYNEAPSGARRFAADEAYYDTIAREVAAYHARQKDEARIAAVFGDKPRTMAQFHGPDAAPDDDSDPVLSPAEEASAPGQTPIGRPPSTIAAAFEAMLAFFICLIGPRPHRKITPAEEIGALAACEVETDFTPDSPPTDLTRLRDLIQRAAEEYAQIRADASKRLDRVAASRRERKAADLAAGRVTEEELREIDARTSGPGPLAEDGALMRRCAAEIRRLTAKLAGIEGVAAQGDGMMATIDRLTAELARWTAPIDVDTEVEQRADEIRLLWLGPGTWASWEDVDNKDEWMRTARPHVEREARLRREIERLTAELARVLAHTATLPPWCAPTPPPGQRPAVLGGECAPCRAQPGYHEESCVRRLARFMLTEEEARETAGPLSRDIYNRIGLATGNKIGAPEWMRDAIAAALLRASREHVRLPPGDVSVPRAALESLVKATQYEDDVREAREQAKRILQRADLAAEPARTDPEAARALAKRGGQ